MPDSAVVRLRHPPSPHVERPLLSTGAMIASPRGTPGTLGAMAVTLHDGALVLLSSHHVLLGVGAREREPVWLLEGDTTHGSRVATSLYGKLGTVKCHGLEQYVDCALAAVDAPPSRRWNGSGATGEDDDVGDAVVGTSVTKTGAGTGLTRGVVVDVSRADTARVNGRAQPAPAQIAVRSAVDGVPFSSQGDSGALLRDEHGRAVGLLWGTNARGESIACPIAPVLQVLGIRLLGSTSLQVT